MKDPRSSAKRNYAITYIDGDDFASVNTVVVGIPILQEITTHGAVEAINFAIGDKEKAQKIVDDGLWYATICDVTDLDLDLGKEVSHELSLLSLPNESPKDVRREIEAILLSHGAKIVEYDYEGVKKMAYPINGSDAGAYHYWGIQIEGTKAEEYKIVEDLNTEFNNNNRVLRHLLVKRNK